MEAQIITLPDKSVVVDIKGCSVCDRSHVEVLLHLESKVTVNDQTYTYYCVCPHFPRVILFGFDGDRVCASVQKLSENLPTFTKGAAAGT